MNTRPPWEIWGGLFNMAAHFPIILSWTEVELSVADNWDFSELADAPSDIQRWALAYELDREIAMDASWKRRGPFLQYWRNRDHQVDREPKRLSGHPFRHVLAAPDSGRVFPDGPGELVVINLPHGVPHAELVSMFASWLKTYSAIDSSTKKGRPRDYWSSLRDLAVYRLSEVMTRRQLIEKLGFDVPKRQMAKFKSDSIQLICERINSHQWTKRNFGDWEPAGVP